MSFAKSIIIAALITSFTSAQSSLTTQYGPSSFCQGYSPGGGDTCITVPSGCYIEPSGYNVAPDLTCTTSSTSSVSSPKSSTPITSSSLSSSHSTPGSLSSSAVPSSSSAVSTAINTAKSTQRSSSSSTTVSSSGSVAASSSSSSPVSSSASITAPASNTAGTSSTSPSAVQSSALPVALSGTVGKVTDAQNSGKNFQDNPTSDTQSAAKQAVDNAKKAAQQAKDAVDPQNSNFDDLSSKLDELLQDLTKSAETLAETAALADMAAALGPELAAAAAAATAAEELEKEDENKPTNKPSASASITQSASLSSRSISSASSSVSSSSSACPFCISCADATLSADGPTDNEEGTIDIPGGGSNTTSLRTSRFARDTNLFRRAQASKEVEICRVTFQSRPYTTGATGNNFRSYGYRYASSTATCKWTFNFVTGNAGVAPGQTQSGEYQTEHVFEAQLKISSFLSTIASKHQPTGSLCSANGLYTRFIARTGAFPGRPGPGVFTGGSPIAELVDNLSSDDRKIGTESEMVFLDKSLNGLKRAVFAEATGRFNFPPLANDKLAKVTRFAMLHQYLTNADIVAIWKATSARMHATLAKVDTESAAVMNPGFSWADEYKTWEDKFLFQQGALVEGALDTAIADAKKQITNNAAIGSQALRDDFVASIDAQTTGAGVANPSNWIDIDDALKMP